MVIDAGLSWAAAVLLCSVRLGAILMFTPLLGGFAVPARIKLMLVLSLSAVLVSGLHLGVANVPANFGAMLAACAGELLTGALLAFGVLTAFGAVAFAGKILDIQMGFGMANVFDPITRTQSPLIGSVLGTLAIVMFFATDSHHLLLRGVAYSLQQVPLGAMVGRVAPEIVVRQFGLVFSHGLLFAAPVVFGLFLLEIGLAVMSRNLPQMNIFIISIPVKIVAGFLLLALLGRQLEPVFAKIFGAIFVFWEALL